MSAGTGASGAGGIADIFQRRMVLATGMVAGAIYSLNLTIVAISLPHMQGTFSATPDQISWVVTAFIVGMTAMIVCTGWISALVGRKRLFVASLACFTATSLMCGNSGSLEEAVLWRMLQGVSGAPIIPLAQAIVSDAYPREEQAKALGAWSIGMMVGPIIAPPIGGWITELYGWPAIFYINLPFGALALFGAVGFVPSHSVEREARVNVFGLLALMLGIVAIQMALNRGTRLDWFASTEVVLETAIGALLIYLFLVHTAVARDAFLKPDMFRDWNFSLGLAVIAFFGILVFLQTLLIPLLLQNYAGYPTETIGLLLAPRAIGVMLSSMAIGWLSRYFDLRLLVAAGYALSAVSFWMMAGWNLDVRAWDVAAAGFVQGVGSNLIFVPINALTFHTLPARHRADGVPLFYLVLNIGASAGIAAVMTYLTHRMQTAHAVLTQHVTPFGAGGLALPPAWDLDTLSGAAAVAAEVARQAGMVAFADTFFLAAVVSVVPIPLTFLLRGGAPRTR